MSLHKPVLLNETIKLLNIKPNGVYVDCTAGFGGHSMKILDNLSNKGKLICIDQDLEAINFLEQKFKNFANVEIFNDNFVNIKSIIKEKVDGFLLDLGVSSYQLDNKERGFSYHGNQKLDMRMNQNDKLTACDILNNYPPKELMRIFREYGEIKDCQNVVNKILVYREKKRIETTEELVNIIKSSIPKWKFYSESKHPARLYFQALRIKVNNELLILENALSKLSSLLNKDGIIAIITFHSLEEKIVKEVFGSLTTNLIPKEIPIMDIKKDFVLLTKKPILPSEEEIEENNRSRSAKLWGVKKT